MIKNLYELYKLYKLYKLKNIKLKKYFVYLMAAVVMIIAGCEDEGSNRIVNDGPPTKAPVSGITLEFNSLVKMVGQAEMLLHTIHPENAENKAVTWTSSNPAVVDIDNMGDFIARDIGVATITVTTVEGNFSATCEITVNKFEGTPVEGVVFDIEKLDIDIAKRVRISPVFDPLNATDKRLVWVSDDESVATITNAGIVEGKGPGTATITITTRDGGFTADCIVTVSEDFLIEDFEWVDIGFSFPLLAASASGINQVALAPDGAPGKVLHVHGTDVLAEWGVVGNRGHPLFPVKLPEGKKLGDFSALVFDSYVFRGSDTGGTSSDGAGWYGGGALLYVTNINGGNVLRDGIGYNWRVLGGRTVSGNPGSDGGDWNPREWARGMTIEFSAVFGDNWTDDYKNLTEFMIGASSDSGAMNFLIDNVKLKK